MIDYYKTLEVSPSSSYEEIKKSYRRLAIKYHPDKNLEKKEAHKLFTEINKAYEVLYDEKSRKRYDLKYNRRLLRQNTPVTPLLFLEKTQSIREFIFGKGKSKISRVALYNALNNLFTDKNIKYLCSQNNTEVNKNIIMEVLKCCDYLATPDMDKIVSKLLPLAGSDAQIKQTIELYIKNHRTPKYSKSMEMLSMIPQFIKSLLSKS